MSDRTILVVDDDALLRCDAFMMLDEAGLSVVEFENADDALSYVFQQSGRVAGIFSDVQTGGDANGIDLARTIAERWPHIAVVLTSGRIDPGPDLPSSVSFVPKPWRPLDVLTAMQNAAAR